ncbi:kinase-like protein [Exidia glandulosa HHB12029]|uniref:Kinase-like protein n=1 Tax=Exidia glandulosa HHB12029 TaxID=1314781 RepID=A0A165GZR6_EXIGL|nr:kinase-like protein [Exidia glandulosa HHB12029]
MASGAGNIGIQAGTVLQLVPFDGEDKQDIIVTSTQTVDVGGSAYVLSGELQQPGGVTAVRVALKVFPTMLSEENQELLRRELNVCRTFRHPLLLPFLGTSAFSLHTILVSYYMANGNLREYLARNPDANRRAFVLQVAEAVHFLHDSKGYVHGDLKCHNVLVTDDERAILADFGLATTIEKAEHETTTATGIRQRNSLRFAAPEILIDEASGEDTPLRLSGSFEDHDTPMHASAGSSQSSVGSSIQYVRKRGKTPPSDVYAFGMVVLEIFTGELPWAGRSEAGVITRVVRGDVPPKPPAHVYTKRGFTQYYWDLCLHCWSFHPQDRPSMNAIVHKLSIADDASASYGVSAQRKSS